MRASELEELKKQLVNGVAKGRLAWIPAEDMYKKKIKRVYVAGAYSADDVLKVFGNMRKGIDAAVEVLKKGYAPFCPWLDYQFNLVAEGITLQEFYNYTLAWLEASDAVLVVPGWENSFGTKNEIARAKELGIPVFYSVEEMEVYCKEQSN
jgi:hypothetical protein